MIAEDGQIQMDLDLYLSIGNFSYVLTVLWVSPISILYYQASVYHSSFVQKPVGKRCPTNFPLFSRKPMRSMDLV